MFYEKSIIGILATVLLLVMLSGCVSTAPEKTAPMPTSTPIPGSLPADVPPYTRRTILSSLHYRSLPLM